MRPLKEGMTSAAYPRANRQARTEVDTALGHSESIQYAGVAVMLGTGALTVLLLPAGHGIRRLSSRVLLSCTGHLRGRPDPWLEDTLRAAFAEFDRELALILQERPAGSPRPDH
jgi:hypothetical protein